MVVFGLSWGTFEAIKATIGLRVAEEHEDAGLDISEHGMYGYPEQFIPAAELVGYGGGAGAPRRHRPHPSPTTQEVTRMKLVDAYVRHEAFEPIRERAAGARASPR